MFRPHSLVFHMDGVMWISFHKLIEAETNGRHFPGDTFKCIFLNENVFISIKISLKFVPKGQINNIPALVQIMAWCRPGDKPLSEPRMESLLTHICVTRPQWVNSLCNGNVALHFYDDFECYWLYVNGTGRYWWQMNTGLGTGSGRRKVSLILSPKLEAGTQLMTQFAHNLHLPCCQHRETITITAIKTISSHTQFKELIFLAYRNLQHMPNIA